MHDSYDYTPVNSTAARQSGEHQRRRAQACQLQRAFGLPAIRWHAVVADMADTGEVCLDGHQWLLITGVIYLYIPLTREQ